MCKLYMYHIINLQMSNVNLQNFFWPNFLKTSALELVQILDWDQNLHLGLQVDEICISKMARRTELTMIQIYPHYSSKIKKTLHDVFPIEE